MKNLLDTLINQCLDSLNSPEHNNNFNKKIIDPLIQYIAQQLWPYILSLSLLLCLLLIMIIFTIYTILNIKNKIK